MTDHDHEQLELPQDLAALVDLLPSLPDGQEPAPYHDGPVQDDLDELGAGTSPTPRRDAVQLARQWVQARRWCGVGYCLRTIRELYGVAALYPDAETAWENTDDATETSDPDQIPWGVPVWWTNGRYGHVAISIGNSRCITTDYVETGRLGVAPIAALGPWCRGDLVGWSRDINGATIWPRKEPQVPPYRLDLAGRRRLVAAALKAERAGRNRPRRVEALRQWRDRLDRRIAEQD